jgi:predicted enzyme related to lactoylglutathione lyase
MQSGPTKVALHGGRTTTSSADAPKLAFKVFDFDTTKKYLESCGVVVGQARSPAEGVLVAEFNDPDGNVLSFESHAVESNNKARSS